MLTGGLDDPSFPLEYNFQREGLVKSAVCASLFLLAASCAAQEASTAPHETGTFANGRYHHNLTGTEFTIPPDWRLTHQGRSGGGGEQATFANGSLHVQALVWLKPHTMAAAEIPEKLKYQMAFKAGQRERVPGFQMLRNTIENRVVGGQAALSVLSQYGPPEAKMDEYHTWIISERTHVYLSVRVPAGDFPNVKPDIEQILATFLVP